MKITLAAVVVLSFSLGLAAQTVSRSAPVPAHRDLNSSLVDLERVSAATDSDIANVHVDKWKSGWKTAWLKDGSRKQQTEQIAVSLRRNLNDAMPGLIHNVQNSRGSISATFKLYDNVNVVYEALDSLVEATGSYGKKDEYGPLSNDFAALRRLRQELSSYIQQVAASVDSKGKMTYAWTSSSAPGQPKKIVIDDTIPEKKPAKKKPVTLTNY